MNWEVVVVDLDYFHGIPAATLFSALKPQASRQHSAVTQTDTFAVAEPYSRTSEWEERGKSCSMRGVPCRMAVGCF